jgi:protocatechuate 3,4-dioxygenase beta subunit
MPQNHHHHEEHDDLHDRGLAFDLATLMQRRRALKLFTGAAVGTAAIAIVGCGDDSSPAATSPAATSTAGSANATATSSTASGSAATVVSAIPTQATPASACTAAIPSETGGPFPGDGSNGPNVLAASGIVRSDIRSSFGTSTTLAKGVPLTVKLTIVDTKNACKPIPGAAVYIWHCDIDGRYSMYSPGATNENYLRGVQAADANGLVNFTSIFPAAYSGRWPHIHFEVYPSLAAANSSKNATATSQLALPEDACNLVYATAGYAQSVQNMKQTSLKSDNVFSDGVSLQTPAMSGNVNSGYTAALTVGV